MNIKCDITVFPPVYIELKQFAILLLTSNHTLTIIVILPKENALYK